MKEKKQISNTVLNDFISMIIPEDIIESFNIDKVDNKKKEWMVYLAEKEELVPKVIRNMDWVLNGFMNQIELTAFPAKGKPVYLRIKRRRWKIRGENKSYFNEYEFNQEGVKATKEFGVFLKELDKERNSKFFSTWENTWNKWKKDL
jgi:hypothetical protein